MGQVLKAASSVIITIVIAAVFSGVALAGIGVWLVYLGSQGDATISLFGQQLKTTMAGLPAIFIGGVIIASVLRSSLKTTHSISGLESKEIIDSGGSRLTLTEIKEERERRRKRSDDEG